MKEPYENMVMYNKWLGRCSSFSLLFIYYLFYFTQGCGVLPAVMYMSHGANLVYFYHANLKAKIVMIIVRLIS